MKICLILKTLRMNRFITWILIITEKKKIKTTKNLIIINLIHNKINNKHNNNKYNKETLNFKIILTYKNKITTQMIMMIRNYLRERKETNMNMKKRMGRGRKRRKVNMKKMKKYPPKKKKI